MDYFIFAIAVKNIKGSTANFKNEFFIVILSVNEASPIVEKNIQNLHNMKEQ